MFTRIGSGMTLLAASSQLWIFRPLPRCWATADSI